MSNLVEIKPLMVSIILPVYNRRYIVQRALQSVDLQAFRDYELLIVDDGSTDGLEEIVLPQIQAKPNWRYLKHSNRKIARTRNIGIRAALGEYVTFLDSDDEYLPDHLALRLDIFKNNPEIAVIHGGVELTGPEETHWVVDARDPSKLIHIHDCCVGATLFARRETFLSVGGFPLVPYSSEFHLLQKLAARQYRIVKVDFPTYVYHTEGSDRLCLNQLEQRYEKTQN